MADIFLVLFSTVSLHWEELATFSFDDDSAVLSDGWPGEEAVLVLPSDWRALPSLTVVFPTSYIIKKGIFSL